MEHSDAHWTDFREILCTGIFIVFVETFQYWINSDKNGHSPWCVFEISSILFYCASWGCRNSWASVTIAYRVLKQSAVYWNMFMNLKLRYD